MLDGANTDGSSVGSFYGSIVNASGDPYWAQTSNGGSVEFILYTDSIEIVSDEGSDGGAYFSGFTGTYEKTGEFPTEESAEDPFNRSNLYGIFELHNDRIDASAEIGYYTSEDGGGYLMLDGATSDGSATGSFYGSLVSASGDHFWAQNEDGGRVEFILYEDSIEIVSDEGSEGGMNFPGFIGTYIKTGELTGG